MHTRAKSALHTESDSKRPNETQQEELKYQSACVGELSGRQKATHYRESGCNALLRCVEEAL